VIARFRRRYSTYCVVTGEIQTDNVASAKKNSIIRIFSISEWPAAPINPDKWSSALFEIVSVHKENAIM
jgi:hypothetical protein